MVVSYGDKNYYALRSDIALAAPSQKAGAAGVLDLDGRFGLHPALASLHELYVAGELAVLHACGNPKGTRSHFEAQDFMESGTAFFALGGGVRGGRVLGDWPGLAPDKLFEGRDLALTTDYRDFSPRPA